MKARKNPNRVAIIGCQDFSAANLYSLLMNGVVAELVLVEKTCENLIEEVSDLLEAVPLTRPARVFQGDFKDAAQAEIIVIASGANGNSDESSLEMLEKNVAIVREIAGKLKENGFDGVILITTAPVEILAQIVLEETDLPANKIIGSGKLPDKEKFRRILDKEADFENETKQTPSAVWCAARTGNSPLVDFCQPNCPEFGKMLEADKQKPTAITHGENSFLFAAGSCVTRICEAILSDEHVILPVAAMTNGQYGISGVFMNLPSIIGRDGVEEIIRLKVSETEKADLTDLSEILKRTFKSLEENKKFLP
jgi:L-lactate dehydrogenase